MKNVKKIRQLTMRLKMQWKILIGVLVSGVACGGVLIFANADSSVSLSLTPAQSSVIQGSTSTVIHANLSGTDDEFYDASNPSNNGIASPVRLEWTISDEDYDVVKFVNPSSGGDAYLQTVSGTTNPTVYGNRAGAATITAAYHSKKFSDTGAVVYDNVLATSTAAVYVPINVNVERKRGNTVLEEADLLKEGDLITITANTCESNKLFIETSNDSTGEVSSDGIVEMYYRDSSKVVLKVIGGGSTVITARTADGSGINPLTYTFTVRAEVKFKESISNSQGHFITHLPSDASNRYMVLSDKDYEAFTYEDIPSNVVNPVKSNVIYKTDNSNVASVAVGTVCGVHAGVTKVSAGLTTIDVGGNESWFTRDAVNVVVPFKKMGNEVSNMNVGDELQLSTSAIESEVTWSTSDNKILQVDSATGLVKAVGAGTATIYATRVQDELYTVYNMPYQLAYKITVIDGFGLSTVSTTVNIGSSIDIKALVTNQPSKSQITYTVTNQANEAGVIPTYDLIEVKQSDDGTVFTITGVASGVTHLTVSQNINGVIKSETCVIYVTTPVGDVSINPSSISIDRGSTGTVQVLFNPAGPTNSNVLWSSSDTTVATVTGDSYTATIKGLSGGNATITVITEDGLKVATCDVYVREPVTGVTLNATTVESTMAIGKYQLVATVKPSGDGVNRNVTWSSSDESVATVDENGVVTALKGGNCVIEVTTDECHLTAACTIVVKEYVSTITLSENNKFVNVGATGKLIATVGTDTATNKNIVWSSSDNSICSVDQEGNLSAESVGNAVITAADGSGVTDSCIIRVVNPVTGIEVVPDSLRLFVGDSQKLGVNVYPDNATIKDVVWKSANESIAVVDEDGEVFAISSGKVKITATSQDGNNIKGICWVYVTPRVNISSLRINSKEIYMLTGRTRQLSVIVRPAVNNDSYEWYSSDTGIVTVDGNGVITTVGPGEAEVYVISDGAGVESSCIVHSLAISRSNITLEQYDRYTLDVIGTDSKITWRSSNPRVCTVSSSGEVIGRKAGIATITAVVNNKTLSCTVRVTSIR